VNPVRLLLAIDGLAYLGYSFTDILGPERPATSFPGSSCPRSSAKALCAWLLLMGLDVERWMLQANSAVRTPSVSLEALP
jgi:hypothetical protein